MLSGGYRSRGQCGTSNRIGKQNSEVWTNFGGCQYTGSKIKSFGTRKFTLHFNSGTYYWKFVVAQVNKPLLEADFLRANKLLVDMANKQFVDASTYCTSSLEHTTMFSSTFGYNCSPSQSVQGVTFQISISHNYSVPPAFLQTWS